MSNKDDTQTPAPSRHQGGCHCGAVRFEASAPSTVTVTLCNCSICAATGFQHLIIPKADFTLLRGADALSEYRFNTGTARHTFCRTCGVKAFYTPRSHPDGISINFRCLDKSGFTRIRYQGFDGQNWEDSIDALHASTAG